jgi:hypothetical protein
MTRAIVSVAAFCVLLGTAYALAGGQQVLWLLAGAGGLVFGLIAGLAFVWARRQECLAGNLTRDYVVPVVLPCLIVWLSASFWLAMDVDRASGATLFLGTLFSAARIIAADKIPPFNPSASVEEPDPRDLRFDREGRGTEELGIETPERSRR